MSVSYSNGKIDEFTKLMTEFNNAKTTFKTQYESFTNTLSTIIENYNNEDTNTGYNYYRGDSGVYYILTPSKILMRTSDTPDSISNTIDDSGFETDTLVDVDGNSVFYSKILFNGSLTNRNLSDNKYKQVGIDKLNANPNNYGVLGETTYEVSQVKQPDLSLSGSSCDSPFYEKCDSYAKMTNSSYYGIGHNDEDCTCYTFKNDEVKNKELSAINQEIINIDVTEALFGDGFDMELSYLGIMMDGGLYGLKYQDFSENYSKAYSNDSQESTFSLVNMDNVNENYKVSNCNMFTGSGPYNIQISSLGEDICTKK
jgi:hypothetical protein